MYESPLPRVMTTAGLRRLHISEAQERTELRRGRWRRLAPGLVLTRPDEPTRSDWINAGMSLAGPMSMLSGWDGVRRYGLGDRRPASPLVLVIARDGRNRVIGGVRIRPSKRPISFVASSPFDEELPSVRFARPARAVADTALQLGAFRPVRALVTSAVQRELCSAAELVDELCTGPRNNSGFLRRALADVLCGARSVAEAEAVDLLRGVGVPPFLVNAPVHDQDGHPVAIADLLWPQLRAIVEIDSREFHFTEEDWKQTMRRHNALTALGYAVAHYPPGDVRSRGRLWAAEVAAWLAQRTASAPSSP